MDDKMFLRIKNSVTDSISKKNTLMFHLDNIKTSLSSFEKKLFSAEEARTILQKVAHETQSEIEDHLSSIVTMALSAVEVNDPSVPKPPEFVVRMVERRDNTECDLLFKEGDREQLPLECSGYGYVDIADYALRVDYILLANEYGNKEVRKTLISDECFRNVDPKLQHKVSEMLLMFSNELGFQQIIVSHGEGINVKADSNFKVSKIGNTSKVAKIV